MSVNEAVPGLATGGTVLVTHDRDHENGGEIIAIALTVTEQRVAFSVYPATGIMCAPLPDSDAARLALPLMVTNKEEPYRRAFKLSVDHIGTGMGLSAAAHRAEERVG
jgi:3,4-dihydroxy 2-butanone 4-phosphate synthase/GTP cyclohydrolase II